MASKSVVFVELTVSLIDDDSYDYEIEKMASEILTNQFGENVEVNVQYSNSGHGTIEVHYSDGSHVESKLDMGWYNAIVN